MLTNGSPPLRVALLSPAKMKKLPDGMDVPAGTTNNPEPLVTTTPPRSSVPPRFTTSNHSFEVSVPPGSAITSVMTRFPTAGALVLEVHATARLVTLAKGTEPEPLMTTHVRP